MTQPIISVRDISKVYRLGEIGMTSLREEAAKGIANLKQKFSSQNKEQRTKNEEQSETEFWALKDVSFDVMPGEVVGIIGKNGAGKSTLLKVISRITEPSHGEIRLRGRVAALLEVGTGFHPELTGRENIYLNGTILGMKKREIDRQLDEIIDFSGIEKHIDTPVKRYSSGMNVRLGFAVAAHLEPEILIVDEVLAVGDAEFQEKCIGKMKNVAGHGRTVLFVSHNMGTVQALCPQTIYLQKGRVHAIGETAQMVGHYLGKGDDSAEQFPELRITVVQDGIETNSVTIGKRFSIEVEFPTPKAEIFSPNWCVFDDRLRPVFSAHAWSSSSAENSEVITRPSAQRHVATTYIEPGQINVGEYFMSFILVNERSQLLAHYEYCLMLNILEDGYMHHNGQVVNWFGVTRPKLLWKVNPL